MESYFKPIVSAIKKYGKASLIALPTPGSVNAIIEIDFRAPISALGIREFFNEFEVSLLVPTGPVNAGGAWSVRPIRFTTIGMPDVQDVREKDDIGRAAIKKRWTLRLKPAFSDDDLDQDLINTLIECVDDIMGRGCGIHHWTDFVIALNFHPAGTSPNPFANHKGVATLYHEDYKTGGVALKGSDLEANDIAFVPCVIPKLDDVAFSCGLERHHDQLGAVVEDDGLYRAVRASSQDEYNGEIDALLLNADDAFADPDADSLPPLPSAAAAQTA